MYSSSRDINKVVASSFQCEISESFWIMEGTTFESMCMNFDYREKTQMNYKDYGAAAQPAHFQIAELLNPKS